jgi:hypothetical protein
LHPLPTHQLQSRSTGQSRQHHTLAQRPSTADGPDAARAPRGTRDLGFQASSAGNVATSAAMIAQRMSRLRRDAAARGDQAPGRQRSSGSSTGRNIEAPQPHSKATIRSKRSPRPLTSANGTPPLVSVAASSAGLRHSPGLPECEGARLCHRRRRAGRRLGACADGRATPPLRTGSCLPRSAGGLRGRSGVRFECRAARLPTPHILLP